MRRMRTPTCGIQDISSWEMEERVWSPCKLTATPTPIPICVPWELLLAIAPASTLPALVAVDEPVAVVVLDTLVESCADGVSGVADVLCFICEDVVVSGDTVLFHGRAMASCRRKRAPAVLQQA
jgi:hypothetical protein